MRPDTTPRKLVLNKTTLRELVSGNTGKGQLGTGLCSDPTTTTEP